MARFTLTRNAPASYGITIASTAEGDLGGTIEGVVSKTDDGNWMVAQTEPAAGNRLTLPSMAVVRDHLRAVAGHPGRRGTAADEALPRALPAIFSTTGAAEAGAEQVEEARDAAPEPLPSHVSGALVRGVGRRAVRDLRRVGRGVLGTITVAGEEQEVRAETPDAIEGTAWIVRESD